ncbi:TIGR00180 family glycosyltransferase [Mangrovibrevibacter kandeliae]|uniref:TIGR00180 family glycosyltransferase n=1 Tax=Mangrovibrevibacter kandeliae TaxID=2968473 RepID=UPI00223001AD|nr:TIGR00180 family glycosyltransferase [Aurantimonas sp. MSK8Z-1]
MSRAAVATTGGEPRAPDGRAAAEARCTLLVPTYNRPDMLRRQVDYLCRSAAAAVFVLDSSEDTAAEANAAAVARHATARYVRFDRTQPVFAKFADGLARVETPFCMIVPDDDFVQADRIGTMVETLDEDPAAAASIGLSFEFHADGSGIHLLDLLYGEMDWLQRRPVERVTALVSRYEALTYAMYRTEVAAEAFALAAGQDAILAQELLQAAVAVARGGVHRVPVFTHGRRAGSSLGYSRWHPLEWLAVDPEGLFRSYAAYRQALLGVLKQVEPQAEEGMLGRSLDLAHLAYLSPYLEPAVLLDAAGRDVERQGPVAVAEAAWDVWGGVRGSAPVGFLRRGGPLTRWLRRTARAGAWRYRLRSTPAWRRWKAAKVQDAAGTALPVYIHQELDAAVRELNACDALRDRATLAQALLRREHGYGGDGDVEC